MAAAATASSPAAPRRAPCGRVGYSYAGFQSPVVAYGVSARITVAAAPAVRSGHVAAWVGFGGGGMGPNGEDEWVQAGIAGYPGGRGRLYYEYKLPHADRPVLVSIGPASAGSGYALAVREQPSKPGVWSVWLDGQQISPQIVLPGSHGAWGPIATAENWNDDGAGCNRYSYDFSSLEIATTLGGGWRPFSLSRPIQDPGSRLRPRVASFAASATP